MAKCVDPLKDPKYFKDSKLVKIVISNYGIEYETCNDGSGEQTGAYIRKFCKTNEELKDMTKGDLYRELRGTSIGYRHINGGGANEIFVVNCVSAERKNTEDWFSDISLCWTESYRTLREACDNTIDIPDLIFGGTDTGGFAFYNCVGSDDEHFDGMDNEDIATYLVTSDDKLQLCYVIRHQCTLPKEELIEAVLDYYKEGDTELVPVSEKEELIKRALEMRERGVEVVDKREKED